MSATGSDRGFTLVEVMLAVSILAIGLVGVLRSYTTLLSGLETAEDSISAVCLAKDKMAGIEEEAIKKLNISKNIGSGDFDDGDGGFVWASQAEALNPSSLGIILSLEEKEKIDVKDYLNRLKVVVSNDRVKPPRRITIWSFTDGYDKR